MANDRIVDRDAIELFQEYLRIPSVHPNVNYEPCVEFLKKEAKKLDLPIEVYVLVPNKPTVVITWEGKNPNLPSVLLNSHMDVVPVFPDKWTHDPFGAEIDENGNIYARGTQDMKCVGMQYLEAIRRLKKKNVKLLRTIHISFVPDEEIGGFDGMMKFVNTSYFMSLNVGFALDEGLANPTEEFVLFYGERSMWSVAIHCPGSTGHGSLLLPDTAGEKVNYIISKFMEFRQKEKNKLNSDPNILLGDVTTINLTQLKGGVQANVVPPELIVVFDIRITLSEDFNKFEKMINNWCKDAGPGTYVEFTQKGPKVEATKLDASNPWWLAFKDQCDKQGIKLKPQIFPAATDSRYIRELGIPALGFSPINHTPVLLHNHDEYLNKGIYVEGIKIYEQIIPVLANVPPKK